jgi:hypothetical protein
MKTQTPSIEERTALAFEFGMYGFSNIIVIVLFC